MVCINSVAKLCVNVCVLINISSVDNIPSPALAHVQSIYVYHVLTILKSQVACGNWHVQVQKLDY